MRTFFLLPIALLLWGPFVSAFAQILPAADAPKPLSPAESASRISLPAGFKIELVASEPVVEEPSCIAFDEGGRIFVCELHGYNVEGHIDTRELNKTGKLDTNVRRLRWELQGGAIADEAAENQFGVLKLLTDTDGDGIMDKAHVWADDLPPCYGVLPARGGVIVTCAPHILYFADRDGDNEPEVRETLFTGFDVHVLERGINNPHWGLDNWIYIGSGGEGGTITGPNLASPVQLGSSDFRIKADGSALEPVNGRVGTFGMTLNDVGDRFPSTGGRPAIYALPLPFSYLARNPHVATPETNHTAADYTRGFRISEPHPWRTKRGKDPDWIKFYGARETNSNYFSGGCSTTYYGDSLFPKEFHGNLFYCEPSLNIIHRTVLRRDGAGYIAERAAVEKESEFLASTDQWFRPMNLRVGPEGAFYIVDMYREIIEDYSAIPRFLQQQYGLDQGKNHGRIWRLLPENRSIEVAPDISKMSPEMLAQTVADDHAWRRRTAQRLLIERHATAARGTLAKLLRAESSTPQAIILALYTLDGLGVLQASDIASTLPHRHYGVRLHALRLTQQQHLSSSDTILSSLCKMSNDPDSAVRLQVAMTLGESDDQRATEALASMAQQHGDERWMAAAILSSANSVHGGKILASLLKSKTISNGAFALIKPLASTLAGRREIGPIARTLELAVKADNERKIPLLGGLIENLSRSVPLDAPDGWPQLEPFLISDAIEIKTLAVELTTSLPLQDTTLIEALFAAAIDNAIDGSAELDARIHSVQLLSSAGFDTLAPAIEAFLNPKQPPALQQAAIAALSASTDARAGAVMLKTWPSLTPSSRSSVLGAIFDRPNRYPSLLTAIEDGIVHPGDLTAIQRDQMINSRSQDIAARARALFIEASANAALQKRLELYQAALRGQRNADHGKEIYMHACVICHQLGSEGNSVGPALGSTVSQPDESILLNILDPGGKIDPEYKLYLITTHSGESHAGVLASESPTSLILHKIDGTADIVLRASIASITASELSLMPTNLHEQLNPQDIADLIAFMRKAFSEEEAKSAQRFPTELKW
ncbi:MAG: putative membrane-bound dehydrogenase-like protein [Verrucomicrobiales bacterium]|jgi:putative membrane-bound dehydrogenase-like protein